MSYTTIPAHGDKNFEIFFLLLLLSCTFSMSSIMPLYVFKVPETHKQFQGQH